LREKFFVNKIAMMQKRKHCETELRKTRRRDRLLTFAVI